LTDKPIYADLVSLPENRRIDVIAHWIVSGL
jgi:hypothetical protein